MSETLQAILCVDGTMVSCLVTAIWQDTEVGCTRGFVTIDQRPVEVAYWQGDAHWYEQCDDCSKAVLFGKRLAKVWYTSAN